jgi:hypothetical protein
MTYHLSKIVNMRFDDAVASTKEALERHNFKSGYGNRFRKKAHRRPDEKVQSSQANRGCMLSGARRVHPVIVGWSTANRPLIAQAHQ